MMELTHCNQTHCVINETEPDLGGLVQPIQTIDTQGRHMVFENTRLKMNQSADISLYVNATVAGIYDVSEPTVLLINSTLRFQLIYINSSYSIDMDSDSVLDADGTGATEGLGWGIITNTSDSSVQSGGSFGG